MKYLLHGVLWATALMIFPGHLNAYYYPKAAMWLVGSWMIASSIWWNTPSSEGSRNPFLGMLVIWVILLFGWHTLRPQLMMPFSTDQVVRFPWVVSTVIPTFIALGSFFAIDSIVRHSENYFSLIRTASCLCSISLVIAIYALFQKMSFDPLRVLFFNPENLNYDLISFTGNEMLTTNFLAVCAPICLAFKSHYYKVIYALSVIVIFLSTTVASMIGLIIGSSVVLWKTGRRTLSYLLLSGSLLVAALVFKFGNILYYANIQDRLNIWYETLSGLSLNTLIFGKGIGAIEAAASRQSNALSWWNMHSEPFQIIYETGLIGFGLVLFALLYLFLKLRGCDRSASLSGWTGAAISFLLISLVGFPLRFAPLLAIGCVIWAALETHAKSKGVRYG